MKKTVVFFACLLLLGFGCGNSETQIEKSTPQKDATTNAAGAPAGSLKTEVRIIPPSDAPMIGGTERDALGEGEECILNGDCKEEGFSCIEGKCVQPQI